MNLLCEGIRQLITLKFKSKIHPNIVKVKVKDIKNRRKIANDFNNFFINGGPNLSKTILDVNHLKTFSKIAQ